MRLYDRHGSRPIFKGVNSMQDYSFLFNTSSSNSTGSSYSWLSEYANIKNGTYKKVLKAYYAKKEGSTDQTTDSNKSTATKDTQDKTATELDKVQAAGKELVSSADALTTMGSKSLFRQKEITTTNEDGTQTTELGYDKDAIYSAVKKFADNYNALLDASSSKDNQSTSVLRQTQNLISQTQKYAKTLGNAGITIGTDNKLTGNEKSFKEADMSTVKALFGGKASFASSVSDKASAIAISANSEANKQSLYNSTGNYSNYSPGNLMSDFF